MLFGTDGIRGIICDSQDSDEDSIEDLVENRSISPRFMKIVGEALSRFTEPNSQVIIGWDDRPGNHDLVKSLTIGLRLGNCRVIHGGLCATPGLHNALLQTESQFGCMITASHNPVSESGIKIFDFEGFKTTPEMEAEISELIIQIAAEDREVDKVDLEILSAPDSVFEADKNHKIMVTKRAKGFAEMFAPINQSSILLDCSKGAPSDWLAELLCKLGVDTQEISAHAVALNDNCGAGELSPTDSWTFEEAKESEHVLIKSLPRSPEGNFVAAALDGDGDRCLLIQATADGFRVVDGDEMADYILRAATGKWHLAASIESDLALSSSLSRLNADVQFSQTAVGDRWLSNALRNSVCEVIGVEDSGHIVLSAPHPKGGRCLVGDGSASLIAVLSAAAVQNKPKMFKRGFKRRISIKNTNRKLWNGKNELSNKIEDIVAESINGLTRKNIFGEQNLMLLESSEISIGIRNSGTQPKTNISLRLAPSMDNKLPLQVVEELEVLLRNELVGE